MSGVAVRNQVPKATTRQIPFCTFTGTLKSIRVSALRDLGRHTMAAAFPNFNDSSLEEELTRLKRLRSLGLDIPNSRSAILPWGERVTIDGIDAVARKFPRVQTRRLRRFAGTDRGLPRGSYYSVSEAGGDDQGTLIRELFEYLDPFIPGKIFVADSFDERLNRALNRGRRYKAGYSGVFVVFFPPSIMANARDSDMHAWEVIYEDLISAGAVSRESVGVVTLGAVHELRRIERVIDLRLGSIQEWFFDTFRSGDGEVFTKVGGDAIRCFADMLPTLMHAEYGGTGATDCIGNWMRVNGVNALIYPAARSDASLRFHRGGPVKCHGWNLVDYRSAEPVSHVSEDMDPWFTRFAQDDIDVVDVRHGDAAGSWEVRGIERYYNRTRQIILDSFGW